MFKKILNSLGVGTATVNLELHNEQVRIGDTVTGTIYVKGGSDETRIDAIHVDLTMKALVKKDDHQHETTVRLDRVTVTGGLTIKPGEQQSFPFRFVVPFAPLSSRYVKHYFNTSLDIPKAIDKHDYDELIIHPSKDVQTVIEGIEKLGFRESADSGRYDGRRYQEFEFKPTAGRYRGQLDEIEVIFLPDPNGVRMHLELDRKNRGLFGALLDDLDLDESKHTVLVARDLLDSAQDVADALGQWIDGELRKY